jgi:serine/threonine protein kinase
MSVTLQGDQPKGCIGDERAPGTILLGRYKIINVLGGGGMGRVYLARDLNFPDAKRLVAVKEMCSMDKAHEDFMIKAFRREANLLALLSHPAIPRVYDWFGFDKDKRAYLVMEYIHGSDLEALLTKVKALPVEKIVIWTLDLLDVLDYLHAQPEPGVFRDLKPSNIMIDHLGKVRLIDFGIARAIQFTKPGTMVGTEGYAPPEQYRGKTTPVSDIYSLGATLHHLLTRVDPRNEPPFSFAERPIKKYNPGVPDWFIGVIEKALMYDAKDRWQSAAGMKQAILDGMTLENSE